MPLAIAMYTPDQCCPVGQHFIGGWLYISFDSFSWFHSPGVLHAVGSRRCNGSFPSLGMWTSSPNSNYVGIPRSETGGSNNWMCVYYARNALTN